MNVLARVISASALVFGLGALSTSASASPAGLAGKAALNQGLVGVSSDIGITQAGFRNRGFRRHRGFRSHRGFRRFGGFRSRGFRRHRGFHSHRGFSRFGGFRNRGFKRHRGFRSRGFRRSRGFHRF